MERNSEENKEVAPTTYTYTSYIQALDKVGRWEDAFEVLERMRRRGVARSAHTYSALVRAGANGGKLGARAAIELIPSMKSDLIEPDLAIASALICAFGVLGSEENARAMLRAIESSGRGVDAKLYTDYITAMCRCGNYDEAKEVFGRVSPRTTFTCTAVMKAYAEAMEWTLAEALFEEMCIDGPKPNAQTHTAILHAYEKSLEWERAVRLLNQLSSRGQAKEIHHNIVLSVLGKCSQWQRAEILFKDMRELYNIRPSRVTYSTLISAYGRSGKTELARKVFLQMLAKRIEPDDYTFVGLMLGPATAGNFRECAKIASEMKDYGVKPTVHTYNTLIQAADIAGNYDKAVELYDELLREGIEPNNTTRELVVAVANRGASFYDRQQKTAAVASYAAGLVGVMGMALGRW
jgi:pentatricopeptide repeat protein